MADLEHEEAGQSPGGVASERAKSIEFQLGARHLTLAVIGLALFGLVLFLLGRWSDRVARANSSPEAAEPVLISEASPKEDAGAPHELTFYETLGKKSGPGFQESRPPAAKKEPPAELPAKSPAAAPAPPVAESGRAASNPAAKLVEGNERYRVQVASTRDRTGAQDLVNRLRRKGYAATLETAPAKEGKPWYKVRVGSYPEREAAEKIATRIRTEEKVGAWIVKVQG